MPSAPLITVEADFGPILGMLRRIADGSGTALQGLVEDASAVLTETMRAKAPVRHSLDPRKPAGGTLKESLVFSIGDMGATLLGIGYAQFVIGGTSPHTIEAHRASSLVFFWEKVGREVRFRKVRHPGTKPDDFRLKGLDLAFETGQIDEAIARFWQSLTGGPS